MIGTNDIRTSFLEYFGRQGHQLVPSSPLVPRNDPTLMFTNAGMVQFKNVFTGIEKRDYARAATSQKCVRAGGKHNDLENVGYTARHHTFFEMLGNFSFGDYFKERAIELAWTLVTKEFGLAKDRLLVTVYAEDDEAHGLWRRVAGLGDDRIIRIGTSDNFWSMGDTGPCGPCSEIFYDHGEGIAGGPPGSPGEDGDRFIEIWNLVFMQFEQLPGGERVALPRPSIDTGMGLERVAAVLQGVHNNYEIDLFQALIRASVEASGAAAEGAALVSHRVIADHLRASAFLIADGVFPSNEGRGYVLRRIMRRAMRHAHLLGCRDPLIAKLVPALVGQMGQAFPELAAAAPLIAETLDLEERRFKTTLERGLKLLADETAKLGDSRPLPGDVAFQLYDTYGFPLDLTQDVLRGQGRSVDSAGFATAMAEQRRRARAAWSGSGDTATGAVWFDLREQAGPTEFLGYETDRAEARVLGLVIDGAAVERAAEGQKISLIANQTPFYAESGGQVGDAGRIVTEAAEITVTDTVKMLGDLWVHQGVVARGVVAVGDAAEFIIDVERRERVRGNHSATHLLHEALRRIVGTHVAQKGSLVTPDRLRFDISHPKALTTEELRAVEIEVNRRIRVNSAVTTRLMSRDEAVAAGAMALFGEKYGDEVRVVTMGQAPGEGHYSVELCGGTHARRTGDIGLFKIAAEAAVAAGVRRIEALTGDGALAHLNAHESLLGEAAGLIKAAPTDLPARLAALIEERRRLERELVEARKAGASGGGVETRIVAGVPLIARLMEGVPARELKGMVDRMKTDLGSGVVALVSLEEGRASLVVGVTSDLTSRFDAVALVKAGAEPLGGKGGGGRPDLAQAGGPEAGRAQEALDAIADVMIRGAN